jgi:hypothetical protein
VWIGLLAAGVSIPYPGVYLIMVLSVFAIAIPTPGGMGPVQFFFSWGLTRLFGVEANLAAAATFLYHPVIVYIPPIVFGLFFAWRDGLSPSSVSALAREQKAERRRGGEQGPDRRGSRPIAAAPGAGSEAAIRREGRAPEAPRSRRREGPGNELFDLPRSGRHLIQDGVAGGRRNLGSRGARGGDADEVPVLQPPDGQGRGLARGEGRATSSAAAASACRATSASRPTSGSRRSPTWP